MNFAAPSGIKQFKKSINFASKPTRTWYLFFSMPSTMILAAAVGVVILIFELLTVFRKLIPVRRMVIFLTMAFVFRNRKSEAFAFYSGLLFGLFGLRNSLPGTPPIGTQSDFLAFVWVEAIVAVMMVVTITLSLIRPQK